MEVLVTLDGHSAGCCRRRDLALRERPRATVRQHVSMGIGIDWPLIEGVYLLLRLSGGISGLGQRQGRGRGRESEGSQGSEGRARQQARGETAGEHGLDESVVTESAVFVFVFVSSRLVSSSSSCIVLSRESCPRQSHVHYV